MADSIKGIGHFFGSPGQFTTFHSSATTKGYVGGYVQFKYDAQKQAALESWSRKREAVTAGS